MALSAFSLTYDFFGSPGCGGSSRLSITPTAAGIVVIDELPGEGDDFRRRTLLAAHSGWRGVTDHLIRNSIVAFDTGGETSGEYPWPQSIELRGRGTLAADMIAIAWAGEPVSHIARVLALHDDTTLEALRVRHGSLRSEAFIDEVMRLKRWADDLGADFDDIIARGPRFGFELREMRKDAVKMARVVEAEDRATKLRREWSLSPFEPQIEALVAAWRRANPATSTNTQMGVGIRSGMLKRALEAYVLERGCLPTGVQRIANDTRYSVGDLTVNLDDLLQASQLFRTMEPTNHMKPQ
jgi:hypothetical protein